MYQHGLIVLKLTVRFTAAAVAAQDVVEEQVAKMWPNDPYSPNYALGNHRIEVSVPSQFQSEPAVQVRIAWRRRPTPSLENTSVVAALPPACDGCNVTVLPNCVLLKESTLDIGFVNLNPEGNPVIHLYYMPYTFSGGSGGYSIKFVPQNKRLINSINEDWLEFYGKQLDGIPQATVSGFFSRTYFDKFSVMEKAASASEVSTFLKATNEHDLVLFSDLRQRQIRMADALPIQWLKRANRTIVEDSIAPGEFYVFVIGLYAVTHDINVTSYSITGENIPRTAVNCFNLEGTRFNGTRFVQKQLVNKSRVGALYFGVDAGATKEDTIKFEIAIHFEGATAPASTRHVNVSLLVSGSALPGNGVRESWRLSRMRWLDSADGHDDNISASYIPIRVTQGTPHFTVAILDRTLTFDRATGLPVSVQSNGHEIMAAPAKFIATRLDGTEAYCKALGSDSMAKPQQFGEGRVTWSVSAQCGGLMLQMIATLTYEGYLNLVATVDNPEETVALKDFRLVVPYRKETAVFGMGIGMISGYRPKAVNWTWNQYGSYSTQPADPKKGAPSDIVPQVWLGTPDAGLRIALKGSDPEWDSPEDFPKVPTASAFANCKPNTNTTAHAVCTGKISVTEISDHEVLYEASLGAVVFPKGAKVPFHFDMLTTPLKPVNLSQHFSTRYFHTGGQMPIPGSNLTLVETIAEIKQLGVTWVVIHQGSNLNPYINYPIREDLMGTPSLKTFVDLCHSAGLRVKLYFTTRELSNRCAEIFALKSLPNHEILYGDGAGDNGEGGGGGDGGGAWLQEHLGGDYKVAWSTVGYPWLSGMKGVRADEAIADNGASRWDNYYVEANAYLLDEPGTDGLYLDAIAFDRTTMERIRKKMERQKPDTRMDIHRSGGWFCHGPGFGTPALRYMQHFAWTDSLWMGEGFDYWGSTPEWWLLETSGLPFGMTGDMIREGTAGGPKPGQGCPDPNRWLGMVFGMATRLGSLGNVESDPNMQEVIPIWKFWKDYELASSKMVGWWSEHAVVETDDPDVKATAYVLSDKMVISTGNFAEVPKSVRLTFSQHIVGPLVAPAVEAFQSERSFGLSEALPFAPKQGWLLVVKTSGIESTAEDEIVI